MSQRDELERFLAGVERRAFRFARVATGNDDDALEIVQEAMLKLVQHYAQSDAAEWPALFHRILQSRIRDGYRRSAVRNRLRVWFGGGDEEDDPLQNQPDHHGQGPLQQLQNERFGGALEQALRALPNRQQQAFLLRAWEGLSVEETARAMGCSAGSVKTHYSRAIQSLRQRLEDFTA
ncbi:MAG: RNA polymerase sigma factor [Gammaproteobacteria bacterium]|nr:RNA polymerase sigma factor [Gammaproteobacteria bacterium]